MKEKWLILFIVSLLIVGFTLPAFGDMIDYVGVRIESYKPTVCIFEPEDPKIQFHERNILLAAVHSIRSWQIDLNRYTDSNNWDMEIKYIDNATSYTKKIKDFKECNVLMVFNIPDNNTKSTQLGWTAFDYSKSTHKYAWINIYTELPMSDVAVDEFIQVGEGEWTFTITPKPFSLDAIETIIKHEFGHALGLYHHQRMLDNHFPSIMIPSFDYGGSNLPDITKYDLEAVIKLYGEDGFKKQYNYQKPSPYRP